MTSDFMTLRGMALALGLAALAACAPATHELTVTPEPAITPLPLSAAAAPSPDPREGLRPGVTDPGQAIWNMRLLSNTPSPEPFAGATNSDLAFTGRYAIQGNYNGFQIWDISDPTSPTLRTGYFCPASQSDVSVYGNLLFVSGEGLSGRIDCGGQGVAERVSEERLRGLRIFDISDLDNPVNVGNVQTCRGSHTHTVVEDPNDAENVYVYISGSAGIRSPEELPGCETGMPDENPNTALFRIEVIKVPLANPARAAIVSSPRIFDDLAAPPRHGPTPAELAAQQAQLEAARRAGAFTGVIRGTEQVLPARLVEPMLDSIVAHRGGAGAATAADSAALRAALPAMLTQMFGTGERQRTGPNQCHDITVYPAVGLAGGACEGYGLLLDISNPAAPVRIDAVSDYNFSYWHSATFNNDGTKVLFTDEWGGGGGPKCRDTDPYEWGANAIFTIENGEMVFQSYYKLPAVQTEQENCVAHNGSLIPVPGRDVKVQGWYQGGISVFDWTDPQNPVEVAFFDRGPLHAERMISAGSWSVYWYNGVIVNSEIARGLDILELTPSPLLTRNEIDAANTVRLEYFNPQGQPRFEWPASFALARAYLDQLQRDNGLDHAAIRDARQALATAEARSGRARRDGLLRLSSRLHEMGPGADDAHKVWTLAEAVRELASAED
jgi:hypothetical protein